MKRSTSLGVGVGLLLLLAVVGLAQASPVWKATLTSSDAGQTNRYALVGNQTYELMCFGATGSWTVANDAGVVVSLTKDQPYPVVDKTGATVPTAARELPVRFAAPSGNPYIAARAWDAGNPDCQVYHLQGGVNATGGALPLGPITPR